MDQGARASSDKDSEAAKIWASMGLGPFGEPTTEQSRLAHSEVRKEIGARMSPQEKLWRAADRRRRLGPLRSAMQKARELDDENSWESAMTEMSQVALDADHPEREAAHLLLAAEVIVGKLTQKSAHALVGPIEQERALTKGGLATFGTALSPRTELLAQVWVDAVFRARQKIKD